LQDSYDDEILCDTLDLIIQRLEEDSDVNNPINDTECLSDRLEDFDTFFDRLCDFRDMARSAINIPNPLESTLKWQEVFAHFFPMRKKLPMSLVLMH
jgi:hypothetical protein